MAATFDRNIGLQNYGNEKVSQYVNSDTGSQQQIFTDPQLLKRIRATTPNRTVSINQSRHPAQFIVDSKQNNTSFVVQSKPVHELYVENTHVAPPTQFIYSNPPHHIHNVHKTYIVGGSAEKVHGGSIVTGPTIIKNPAQMPMPPPLTVNPAFLISPPQNGTVFIEKPMNKSQSAARLNISNTVSLLEFQRLQSQCRQWQQKYNDLYRKFTSLSSTKDIQADQQINRLRTQNYELQQRILMYQRSQSTINQTVEAYITQLINRHRSSTLKECQLLFDRFKLECRQMERDPYQPPY